MTSPTPDRRSTRHRPAVAGAAAGWIVLFACLVGPAGASFIALQVIPEVWKIGAHPELDTRLRRATIWVADDPDRTLRIRSEIFIGALTLDLVTVEPAA